MKNILMASAAFIATIGGLFLAQLPQSAPDHDQMAVNTSLERLVTKVIAIPVINERRVIGYFLSRLRYSVSGDLPPHVGVPLDALMRHALHVAVHALGQVDLQDSAGVDTQRIADLVTDNVNDRLGVAFLSAVELENVDFLLRSNNR